MGAGLDGCGHNAARELDEREEGGKPATDAAEAAVSHSVSFARASKRISQRTSEASEASEPAVSATHSFFGALASSRSRALSGQSAGAADGAEGEAAGWCDCCREAGGELCGTGQAGGRGDDAYQVSHGFTGDPERQATSLDLRSGPPSAKPVLQRFSQYQRLSRVAREHILEALTNTRLYKAATDELAWFQFAADHMWEYIDEAISQFLLHDLTHQIQENCADIPVLSSFKFTRCSFGASKPTFGPLTARAKDDCVELLIDMWWDARGSELEVEVGGVRVGLKDIKLHGPILLVFAPLLKLLPITGGLSITFPDPPDLAWEWTGFGKAFSLKQARVAIVRALFETIVVPSRVYIDIAQNSGLVEEHDLPFLADYRSPLPLGVLRIEVVRARNLVPSDLNGYSDPYVVVRVGNGAYTTGTVTKCLDPEWGEFHAEDFIIYHMEQRVFIDLYDEDRFSQDEILGSVYLSREGPCARGVGEGLRPTVSELVEKPDAWWPVDTSAAKHKYRDRYNSEVWLKIHWLNWETTEQGDAAREIVPNVVNCPKRCGNLEEGRGVKGLAMARCRFCFRSISQTWKQWFSSKPSKMGRICPTCRFAVCDSCWFHRRPSCALLRIVLRSALVPVQDVEKGAVVSVEFEGKTLRSQASRPRSNEDVRDVERTAFITNLHRNAGLDASTIAKCLNMHTDEVKQVIAGRGGKGNGVLTRSGSNRVLANQEVVWEEAMHFLVKNPTWSTFEVKVVYKANHGGLFGSRKLTAQHFLRPREDARGSGTASVKKRPAVMLLEELRAFQTSLTWSMPDAGGDHIDIDVDVRLDPLIERRLHS